MSTSKPAGFQVRSLTASVYLPSVLFAVGQGAAIPILPLLALDLGMSVPMAGAVVAARALGTLAFDVPAGVLVSRWGERRAMLGGTVALAVSAVGIGLGPSTLGLFVLVFLMGAAWSVWLLARLAYAAEITPQAHRGRVMSVLGGLGRIGAVIGPLVGGGVVAVFGLAAAFYLQAAFAALAFVALAVRTAALEHDTPRPENLASHLRGHFGGNKRVLLTVAAVSVAVQVLRSARSAFLPLWGDAIDLSATEISILFGIMSAAEVAVFYPAGVISDRLGRKWAAIPCLGLLTLGLALVPATAGFGALIAVGLILGIGNGFGSGIQMTLGSDLAPANAIAAFLGVWRVGADAGAVAGPAVIALAASAVGLSFAAVVLVVVGLAGATVMGFFVPETLNGPTQSRSP